MAWLFYQRESTSVLKLSKSNVSSSLSVLASSMAASVVSLGSKKRASRRTFSTYLFKLCLFAFALSLSMSRSLAFSLNVTGFLAVSIHIICICSFANVIQMFGLYKEYQNEYLIQFLHSHKKAARRFPRRNAARPSLSNQNEVYLFEVFFIMQPPACGFCSACGKQSERQGRWMRAYRRSHPESWRRRRHGCCRHRG